MPVCLPSREPRVSDTCCVTGWGDVKGNLTNSKDNCAYVSISQRLKKLQKYHACNIMYIHFN